MSSSKSSRSHKVTSVNLGPFASTGGQLIPSTGATPFNIEIDGNLTCCVCHRICPNPPYEIAIDFVNVYTYKIKAFCSEECRIAYELGQK